VPGRVAHARSDLGASKSAALVLLTLVGFVFTPVGFATSRAVGADVT
jgi:hypothetical protein